jgi:hypothetical protein
VRGTSGQDGSEFEVVFPDDGAGEDPAAAAPRSPDPDHDADADADADQEP